MLKFLLIWRFKLVYNSDLTGMLWIESWFRFLRFGFWFWEWFWFRFFFGFFLDDAVGNFLEFTFCHWWFCWNWKPKALIILLFDLWILLKISPQYCPNFFIIIDKMLPILFDILLKPFNILSLQYILLQFIITFLKHLLLCESRCHLSISNICLFSWQMILSSFTNWFWSRNIWLRSTFMWSTHYILKPKITQILFQPSSSSNHFHFLNISNILTHF